MALSFFCFVTLVLFFFTRRKTNKVERSTDCRSVKTPGCCYRWFPGASVKDNETSTTATNKLKFGGKLSAYFPSQNIVVDILKGGESSSCCSERFHERGVVLCEWRQLSIPPSASHYHHSRIWEDANFFVNDRRLLTQRDPSPLAFRSGVAIRTPPWKKYLNRSFDAQPIGRCRPLCGSLLKAKRPAVDVRSAYKLKEINTQKRGRAFSLMLTQGV